MSDNPLSYFTRFYAKNPGGAYDPAPMHEFDLDEMPHPPTIMPGDTLCHWSRIGNEAEGRNYYYKVIDRTFRFNASGPITVFILIEETHGNWTEHFN